MNRATGGKFAQERRERNVCAPSGSAAGFVPSSAPDSASFMGTSSGLLVPNSVAGGAGGIEVAVIGSSAIL